MPIDPTARKQKLNELKKELETFIDDRQKQLHLEFEFLKLVLESQGLLESKARRTANLDKLKCLATAKALLPTAFLGKDASEQEKIAAAQLDGLVALKDAQDPFVAAGIDNDD